MISSVRQRATIDFNKYQPNIVLLNISAILRLYILMTNHGYYVLWISDYRKAASISFLTVQKALWLRYCVTIQSVSKLVNAVCINDRCRQIAKPIINLCQAMLCDTGSGFNLTGKFR